MSVWFYSGYSYITMRYKPMIFNKTLLICSLFPLFSTHHPSPSSPFPVFSDLWSGDQEAGDSLCSSEPNQNRGGALQSSATAANTEGLSGAGMPHVESQQVEWGMFALLAVSSGSQNSLSGTTITVTAAKQLRHKHKHSQRLPRGCKCRTCIHTAPVQSLLSLFFKHNVSFPLSVN